MFHLSQVHKKLDKTYSKHYTAHGICLYVASFLYDQSPKVFHKLLMVTIVSDKKKMCPNKAIIRLAQNQIW